LGRNKQKLGILFFEKGICFYPN